MGSSPSCSGIAAPAAVLLYGILLQHDSGAHPGSDSIAAAGTHHAMYAAPDVERA